MKTIYLLLFLLLGLSGFGCSQTEPPPETSPKPRLGTDSQTGWPIVEIDKTLVIEPELVNCSCFVEKKCMVINGESECEGIRGFTFERGVRTTILVDVMERPHGIQDVGRYGYIFKRVVRTETVTE